jgi:hypothetical protein
MAIKLPPIKRSVVISILQLILGILTGSGIQTLLDDGTQAEPVCPPASVTIAERAATRGRDAGIGGNSAVAPAGGAPALH